MRYQGFKPAFARLFAAAQGAALLSWGACAAAEELPAIPSQPPLLSPTSEAAAKPKHGPLQLQNFMALPVQPDRPSRPRQTVNMDLEIRYLDGVMRNPSAEQGEDHVRLRGYRQWCDPDKKSCPQRNDAAETLQFVAPRIEARPGQTVRVTLHNNLPDDPSCVSQGGSANTPHCFNGSNLHTHGLWVNPAGNSDNVMINIQPGVAFQYEYNIPQEHPAGTYWYHTHVHGSTALQVSSGMAGALIIRGDRQPQAGGGENGHGDLDTLLKPVKGGAFQERTLVFQQIQYACRDQDGKVKTYPDERYRCDAGDVGKIDGYDLFGPGRWEKSGRYTSINGMVMGKLPDAAVGQVQRWRMIHGGVRDTIALELRLRRPHPARTLVGLTAEKSQDYVAQECTGDPLPLTLVAADGLTLGQAMQKTRVVFQPGYRWDALMVFPKSGDYCLINRVQSSNVDRVTPYTRLLGIVHVKPAAAGNMDGSPAAIERHVKAQLIKAARRNYPSAVAKLVVADLERDIKLTRFVPHADILANEVTGRQRLAFNIDTTSVPGASFYQVDGKPYDGSRMDRVLPLGGVDEWTLTSDFVSHPFHIHVNPFQIVKILDNKGRDVSGPQGVPGADEDDEQYRGMKGMWKDTLWIKNLYSGDPNSSLNKDTGKYTFIVRTRYERYIGDFVLHCHILDHEDQGMMQNVRIALPDEKGNPTSGHH
ncbi:multicopper oxidase domain-containing protein [Chromobacterium subtsugae]|uniref:Multicopper oxidase domain-containing protein n=1 Tax=Chromobacterium subtsugae TaxID=251747 RepID=A0ABS7FKC4_9NEIS|nr:MULTISPECIES: multicopper oxidase family protein [Chromobacterium]KUM05064.1 hypothetical protein Cv017_11135 [Chromobacterium subtsugae]KZE85313.1 hypothetical protein AWB61_20565 [Chromobacterium sp. F49]MBW7569035.1 multicopper oxidase domain-containing protein [Chromobacterium subtsugae]MBW8289783.1 multicopper oxidase domain-containing protein [Chromobacterium subtsugae]WSE93696.1 multicopper oxidase family protein [Chromobacterium subtsugae]